jgi:8-oxo-dGTP diphosphatase
MTTLPSTQATEPKPLIEVVVGILFCPNGRLLFARRPAGTAYAGYWEFPGGKVELGETTKQALRRELEEEIGIKVQSDQVWKTMERIDLHAKVRLYFYQIAQWIGEPQGLEGQDIEWQKPPITLKPLLPATEQVLAWMIDAKLAKQSAPDRERTPNPC